MPGHRSGRARRVPDRQPAGHGRLCHPRRNPKLFEDIRTRVPNSDQTIFSAHCHDDLGLAVANSSAAIQGGVRQVECTINGIGERAGNASVEEIVMALRVRSDRLPYTTDIKPRLSTKRVNCSRGLRASRFRPTRPSWVEMLLLMKPVSTRMAS